MEWNEQIWQKIEDYLKGKLPSDEASGFEADIRNNPELAEMVDLYKLQEDGIELLVEKDLKEKLNQWETAPPETPPGSSGFFFRWWILGVLLLCGLVLVVWMWPGTEGDNLAAPDGTEAEFQQEESPSNASDIPDETVDPSDSEEDNSSDQPNREDETIEKQTPPATDYGPIAMANYEPPGFLRQVRGDKSIPKNDLDQAIAAFQEKDFGGCIRILAPKLGNITKQEKQTLAHAYFASGQYDRASSLFGELKEEETFNPDEPEWYLLLSLAANYEKNKTEVDSMISKISREKEHGFYSNAIDLKSQLQ